MAGKKESAREKNHCLLNMDLLPGESRYCTFDLIGVKYIGVVDINRKSVHHCLVHE